jgi:hypothetical protein
MMTREQAIEAYGRVGRWEKRASAQLLADMRAKGACDPIPLTLHNWGKCAGREPYKSLCRYYDWKQRQIWDAGERLQSAFAKYF